MQRRANAMGRPQHYTRESNQPRMRHRNGDWDVVVVGGAGIDYVAQGPELPSPSSPVQGDRFLAVPGGKGLNAAVAAARLGARVALVARVGEDENGARVLGQLEADGVNARHVRRDPFAPTGITLVQVSANGRKQTLAVPGANASLTPEDVRSAAPLIAQARVLLAQLEPPTESINEAFRLARSSGARVILDPAPPSHLDRELLTQVEILKPNADEAEALTGIGVKDIDSARRAAEILLGRGVAAAVIEAGMGTLLQTSDEEHWIARIPVETIDTTGAGDALAAGLAVSLAGGQPLLEGLRFGNAVAALATTRLGGIRAMPSRSEVLALLRRVGLSENE